MQSAAIFSELYVILPLDVKYNSWYNIGVAKEWPGHCNEQRQAEVESTIVSGKEIQPMRNSITRRHKAHPFGRSWKAEQGQQVATTPEDAAATEARIDALLRERGQHDVADARMARRAAMAQQAKAVTA